MSATRYANMGISFAESSSSWGASAMSRGSAICEEFCEEVLVGSRILELDTHDLIEIEEIKCTLSIVHFTGLTERMVQEGYCCTQVQRDVKSDKCFAWFEPSTCRSD